MSPLSRRLRTRLLGVLLMSAGAASACEDGPTNPDFPDVITCSDPPVRVLTDSASGTLAAGPGPYVLEDTVRARRLRVEAGALVCGRPGAVLSVDTLVVAGTAERPVVFTAMDPAHPWGGIGGPWVHTSGAIPVSGPVVDMTHAVVEHAAGGVGALTLTLASVRFRQIGWSAFSGAGTVVDVRADSVCTRERDPVPPFPGGPFCSAFGTVSAGRAAPLHLRLERVTLHDSGGHGLDVSRSSVARVSELQMEELGGRAVMVATPRSPYSAGELEVVGPVTVRGHGGVVASGAAHGVASFMAAYAEHARAGDTVLTIGSTSRRIVVPAGVIWRASGDAQLYDYWGSFRELSIGPGGRFEFSSLLSLSFTSIEVLGSAENPAWLTSDTPIYVNLPGKVVLQHARVRAQHAFEAKSGAEQSIADSDLRLTRARWDSTAQAAVTLGAPRARVTRTSVETAGLVVSGIGAVLSDLRVANAVGPGVTVQADSARISACRITGSAGDGIRVARGVGVVITDCDLEENAGAGVGNEGADTVTARGNWWGDPAGPLGPMGDGVRGAVDYGGFRVARRGSTPAGDGAARPTGKR